MLLSDTPTNFSALADAGWRAPSRESVGGWEARFASGVTKRANSAWAGTAGHAGAAQAADTAAVSVVSADAFAAVEAAYRGRDLPPCFQLSGEDATAYRLLIGRGYRIVDETLVLAASVKGMPGLSAHRSADRRAPLDAARGSDVHIAEEPSDEWLACWWAVDGRGGDAELEIARRIITATPSLYVGLRVGGAVVAVARLALLGPWGGLYCVATLPEHRRRGYSARVVGAALAAGAECGVTDAWLQVLAANSDAIALYSSRFGFAEAERYRYALGPLRVPAAPACR